MQEVKRGGASRLAASAIRSARVAAVWVLGAMAVMMLSAPVYARCSWVTAPTAISFGDYSVFSTPSSSHPSFTMEIRCNPNSTGTVTLSRSSTTNSFNPRAMAKSSEAVRYNVFLDAAGQQIFGDGQGGTTGSINVNSSAQEKNFFITMYFITASGEDVTAGTYSDTLTLTLDPMRANETATRTFTVTTVVLPECTVQTFALNFGTYDPIGAHETNPLDASGTPVNVYCTKGVKATTALSQGSHFGGTPGSRRMAFGTHRLAYGVFLDAARQTPWGTVGPTASMSKNTPVGNGYPIFGRIPPDQIVGAGSYADTVVATVTY